MGPTLTCRLRYEAILETVGNYEDYPTSRPREPAARLPWEEQLEEVVQLHASLLAKAASSAGVFIRTRECEGARLRFVEGTQRVVAPRDASVCMAVCRADGGLPGHGAFTRIARACKCFMWVTACARWPTVCSVL